MREPEEHDGKSTPSDLELVRAYQVHGKMMRYPDLINEIRGIFRAALFEKGIVSSEELEEEARAAAGASGGAGGDANRVAEYFNALTDLHFVRNFTDAQIEDHINFARKKASLRKLSRVVNTEGVTSLQIKQALKEFCDIPQGELILPPSEAEGVRVALINHFISNQLPFIGIAKSHITIRDMDEMLENSYWCRRRSGKTGGKAAGMFLAYKIALPRFKTPDPDFEEFVRIPESYYLNTGITADFIDHNDLHHFHSHKYKDRDEIERQYREIQELTQKADFAPDVVESFRDLLQRVGEHPLILRSSSLLEDNFGHAFSGKYDSVFVANQGDLERRLEQFVGGLKRVIVSAMGLEPILYRRDHNLLDFDEGMAVLVQKVVGRRFGDYFFPCGAGVAYSYNVHRWSARIRQEDGLVRLVFGLGTRAVDRVAQDYPRMLPLSHPLLRPEADAAQIAKYSQKMVDVLNLRTGEVESDSVFQLLLEVSHPDLYDVVSVNAAGHLAAPMFRTQDIDVRRSCVTFENLIKKTPFVRVVKKLLRSLHEAYGRPVDVEFAWDDGLLYLLQCRPLPIKEYAGKVTLPEDVSRERILFTTSKALCNSVVRDIEYVVYVDPRTYGDLPTREEKIEIGRVVSRINRALEGRRYALLGPGRWGSNDINLGVKVAYHDINRTLILGEVAFEEGGSTPEVSYGTHFFNDLLEAEIVPVAIYPDEKGAVFQETFLTLAPNQLASLAPEAERYANVVRVVHLPSCGEGRLLHVFVDGEEGRGMGFLGRPDELETQGAVKK